MENSTRLDFGESALAVGSMLDALVDLLGASGFEPQRVQDESFNNANATTFNIDYACRIGIGSFGADKVAQMVIALLLKFVDAGSFAWVSHPHRTTVGMQWIQAMATEICGGTLEIWKLCRFVAGTQQVDQTCACPAPAAKETWTNMSL